MYRQQYNVPRVPVDRTDLLTEYEFEYEFLLKSAYNQWVKESVNGQKIRMADGSLYREFVMDEEAYQEIVELAEQGEYIDLEIPKDAPEGKRLSQSFLDKEANVEETQVPVDLVDLFGGEKGGGSSD